MEAAKKVLRALRGGLIAVFCAAHLLFLLTNALPSDMRREMIEIAGKDEKKADSGNTQNYETLQSYLDIARGYERLTSTPQSWGMFAPNVGDYSDTPTLALFYSDGTRELLYSPTQPRLIHVEPTYNFLHGFADLERRKAAEPHIMDVSWPLHLGDARIRKVESYVIKQQDTVGMWGPRQSYVRWRLIDHLRRNPARQGKLLNVELWVVRYEHTSNGGMPGYGRAYLKYVRRLGEYKPSHDSMWPKSLAAEPKK